MKKTLFASEFASPGPKPLPEEGAVFFGYSTVYRLLWPTNAHSEPEEDTPAAQRAPTWDHPIPVLVTRDSSTPEPSDNGLGSSFLGSFRRNASLQSVFSRSPALSSSTGHSLNLTSETDDRDESAESTISRWKLFKKIPPKPQE